ncbi:MAG: T9SS type A sorting domain-containing protein [Lentimicrobium sp.]|nr:T9SS type A sorting domain-containing protein [Lentimicrobium sp.]
MGNSATSSSYQDIASLIYQSGVSVDMNYNTDASGAFDQSVPVALSTYFNYNPSCIGIAYKSNYSDSEWMEMLKSELSALRPIYYDGNHGTENGHAWVCDGWRSADNMFHMNWGWSGFCNGWYAIGALNPDFFNFNDNNLVVKGIKPGNPDLVVRITNIQHNAVIGYGQAVGIDCSVIKGSPIAVNLYMDSELLYSTSQANFTYNLITTDYFKGIHILKVEAINATDTVYSEVKVGNCEWVSQASAFTNENRGIQYIHALDSLVVWATAYDGINLANPVQEFTRTGNGGKTWNSGVINNCSGLSPAMIFALSIDTAFCPMYRRSGSRPQGIYMTTCGGSYWTIQTDPIFVDPASFPNVVHFFNHYDGFCMGDPVNGEFEIYVTSNGGTTWTPVIGADIPDPVEEEYGVIGYYSAFADKAWFGTSKGRVYRTGDRGCHWDVSTTSLPGKYVDVEFANGLHGLAQDKDPNTSGTLSETFDGGVTWNTVISTGDIGVTDFCFVPGTGNMWVSTDAGILDGVFCSFDGGHSWATMALDKSNQYLAVDFINDSCGWAGDFNESADKRGMFRFGSAPNGSVLSPVTNLYATITGAYVSLTWNAPSFGNITAYNVYRNDTLLNVLSGTSPFYIDVPVPNGLQTYCITVVYDEGESDAVCTQAWITYGISEMEAAVKVYPNPAGEVINIETPVNFSKVRIFTVLGQEVYTYIAPANKLKILTAGFKPGIYLIQLSVGDKTFTQRISIR